MAAGAANIHYGLLVVAADDGVMPQTREHLDILTLLLRLISVVLLIIEESVSSIKEINFEYLKGL